MSSIGERIKFLRESKGYSQRKLSYLAGISNATINRAECGISIPKPSTLKSLSSALSVPYGELLNTAGYLDAKKFVPSNIKLIMERNKVDYIQLADKIKEKTGDDISADTLKLLENGRTEAVMPEHINAIARYEGVSPDFFFRENTPEDLEYAINSNPYKSLATQERRYLQHIKDEKLKNWIDSPENIEYILFAKKVSDLAIDPQFILNEFVFKIFKPQKDKK